jgi:CO/xanthine dehydrogenase FAD-binding subunit
LKIKKLTKPASIEEAYDLLTGEKKALIVAGGAWLKLMPSEVDVAVDLSVLGLDSITKKDGYLEVGAMVTLRQIEKNNILKEYYNGIISDAAEKIMGVTVRNIATIGGTVAGKYGFSDILTPLLAIRTELDFYKRGRISLEQYLGETRSDKDILLGIRIPLEEGKGWFSTVKITAIDFPVINTAVIQLKGKTRIAVGSRPYKAVLAEKAMAYIDTCPDEDGYLERAALTAAAELKFGNNARGSAEYRKQLCITLVKRGLGEVMS